MGCFSQDVENRRMHSAIATTPTRRKEAIMRWHSYQSLLAHARRKRVGSTGILPVGPAGFQPARRFAVAVWVAERRRKHCAYRPLETKCSGETPEPHRQDACTTCD